MFEIFNTLAWILKRIQLGLELMLLNLDLTCRVKLILIFNDLIVVLLLTMIPEITWLPSWLLLNLRIWLLISGNQILVINGAKILRQWSSKVDLVIMRMELYWDWIWISLTVLRENCLGIMHALMIWCVVCAYHCAHQTHSIVSSWRGK